MKQNTETTLVLYVIALMEEGFTALHVGEIIPNFSTPRENAKHKWSQFPKLESLSLGLLADANITYDQPSGWFRKNY